MEGKFPQKETDFVKLCNNKNGLTVSDMVDLFKQDFPDLMSDINIKNTILVFLRESIIKHKSFEKLLSFLEKVEADRISKDEIVSEIKKISFSILGRDIYKREIEIVDGHDCSSYFWIMPVRIVDYRDTAKGDCVAEMRSNEISIEEMDIYCYLTPFLYKYFDKSLKANQNRVDIQWKNDNGSITTTYYEGFEWYLTYNFYTFKSVNNILNDIRDTIDALESERETEYTKKLSIKEGVGVHDHHLNGECFYKDPDVEHDFSVKLVIDFYKRFIYRMEYMIKVGAEKGFDLISFMGP